MAEKLRLGDNVLVGAPFDPTAPNKVGSDRWTGMYGAVVEVKTSAVKVLRPDGGYVWLAPSRLKWVPLQEYLAALPPSIEEVKGE